VVVGLAAGIILVAYGIVPTYQATHFGRVYAAYGDVDRVTATASISWGGPSALAGIAVIMCWPLSCERRLSASVPRD
jgi:drug/metabolite transporter superfamily protein YnfA